MKLQCPDDYRVIMVDFPGDVLAAVRVDDNGYYTIYINDRLSLQARREALKHELNHIMQGDFDNHLTIYDIEARACAAEKLPRINMQSRKRFVTEDEFLSLIEIGKPSSQIFAGLRPAPNRCGCPNPCTINSLTDG